MAHGGVQLAPDWKLLFQVRDEFTSAHRKRFDKPLPVRASVYPVTNPADNVVGAGVGYKERDGKLTSELSIIVYVERKLPKAGLEAEEIIPADFKGVPTDVIESGRFYAIPKIASASVNSNAAGRHRPVQPGCSIGFQYKKIMMAGTLGAIVTSRKSGAKMLLSNNHVLCFESRLPTGAPIFQPGLLDGGNPTTDRIAEVSQWTDLGKDNLDAAVATLDLGTSYKPDILGFGRLTNAAPLTGPEALLEKNVMKAGRSTDLRSGTLKSLLNAYVDYAYTTRWFQDLVLIADDEQPFSEGGDSGALIFSPETEQPVGLLVARGDIGTLAHPLGAVLDRLQVSLEI